MPKTIILQFGKIPLEHQLRAQGFDFYPPDVAFFEKQISNLKPTDKLNKTPECLSVCNNIITHVCQFNKLKRRNTDV